MYTHLRKNGSKIILEGPPLFKKKRLGGCSVDIKVDHGVADYVANTSDEMEVHMYRKQ